MLLAYMSLARAAAVGAAEAGMRTPLWLDVCYSVDSRFIMHCGRLINLEHHKGHPSLGEHLSLGESCPSTSTAEPYTRWHKLQS